MTARVYNIAITIRKGDPMAKVSTYVPNPDMERAQAYAEKLAEMIRYETVSIPDTDQREKFLGFHKVLEGLFPTVFAKLEKTEIDGNLLFYWPGREHDKPILLMSHQDVVPAEGTWQHPPFSGDIDEDGILWGRGTADIKTGVFGFLQAAEELLQEGFEPPQDIYLSSSCTEEVNGDGAPKLVNELKRRGVRIWLLCDEGGAIVTDPMAGVKGNFAMVGVFEKGMGNIKFIARGGGGHSSMPPKDTPIDRLAAFVNDVKKHDPMRSELSEYVKVMFKTLGPYCDGALGFIMRNCEWLAPIIKKIVPSVSSAAAAMFKTTIAFTRMEGSQANNVIPSEAYVVANMRFIPHQGVEESLAIMEKIAKKYDLDMEVMDAWDATTPVDITSEAWAKAITAIEEVFPGLPHSPYVVTGGTDARFYRDIADTSIRFTPVVFGPAQMKGMHGIDERVDIRCLPGCVDFFKALMR